MARRRNGISWKREAFAFAEMYGFSSALIRPEPICMSPLDMRNLRSRGIRKERDESSKTGMVISFDSYNE